MQAQATAKFVRFTPRKTNQVLSLIRGQKVSKALEILYFLPKSASTLVEKVLKSAIANSGSINDFTGLSVKQAWVGPGPTLKRMRPGPQGRAMAIRKRTVHLTIVVTDEQVGKSKKVKVKNKG
ncbi:MAG: 50S ribosomal protein L22 [Elusimicrobiota bacterium]|jgi:large subunit ribosomal protein L22|nr:50S ribosomal protein L22 [Elusimicrobiota bacterium]